MSIKTFFFPIISLLALAPVMGCIRAQYYRTNEHPTQYSFSPVDERYGRGYFRAGSAYEAYVEFDARGSLYHNENGATPQLADALDLIRRCRFRPDGLANSCAAAGTSLAHTPKPIALYIFVHGWKNNASDDSGNTWGFRRFLSYASYHHPEIPVVGIYMGWPGAVLKDDLFLSFWNREPIADIVGNSNDFRLSLKRLLHEAKGRFDPNDQAREDLFTKAAEYGGTDHSVVVVIGHSFGGIVLEHAATALLQERFDAVSTESQSTERTIIDPPADLFVLINEAGAASIAKPFLDRLKSSGLTYNCITNNKSGECPLILSMTSEGDLATKFAYPGGEVFSWNRPPTPKHPVDQWGQDTDTPYELITAANFVALQSHSIDKLSNAQRDTSECIVTVRLPAKNNYCMHSLRIASDPESLKNHPNDTPYWLMQLPQVFVPDHGTVFQDTFLRLLDQVAHPEQPQLALDTKQLRNLQSK